MRTALLLSLLAPTLVVMQFGGIDAVQRVGPSARVVRSSSTVPTNFSDLDDVAGTLFGISIAVDGDLAVIGAPGNAGAAPGSVYVLRRDSGAWTVRCPAISSPSGSMTGNFGASVALLGTTAVIGEPRLGVTGAAYVADLSSDCPTLTALAISAELARAGSGVAIADRWVVVGAPGTDTTMSGGAVQIFDRATATSFVVRAPTTGSAGNLLGWSVAVAGDVVVAGAPGASMMRGAAFVYSADRSTGSAVWSEGQPLGLSPGASARYGASVALNRDGTLAVVGAPRAVLARGTSAVGGVLLFERASPVEAWPAGSVISAEDDASASDDFGWSVAVDGTDVLVGAPRVDVDGRVDAGAVYHFVGRGSGHVRIARYEHDEPLSSANPGELVGYSVAISGDHLIAGAPGLGAPGMSVVVGVALQLTPPAELGSGCDAATVCENGFCVDRICCEVACDGPCQACGVGGACMPADEPMCSSCGVSGTCRSGACVIDVDAMCEVPDGGGMVGEDAARSPATDAGRRSIVRVSGCKCGVATGHGPGRLASVALALVGVALLARRRRVSRVVATLALGLLPLGASLFAAPLTLRAQEGGTRGVAPSDMEVQTLLTEALREFDGGHYTEAYALFRRLHEIAPSARTARGIGNTAFELRRYAESIEWLEQSLADTRRPLTDELRVQVETLLLRARSFIAHYTIRANAPAVQLTIDGDPLTSEERVLDVGEHTLEAHAPGFEPLSRRITVRGGESETIELTMIPTGLRAEGHGTPVDDPGAFSRDFGFASLVAGGVGVIGGVIATVFWSSNVGALNANLEAGVCSADPVTESVVMVGPADTSHALCLEQQSRYRLALPFVWTGFVAGAAFLGTGLGLLLLAPGPSSGETSSMQCGFFAEGGVSCAGMF